MKRSSLPLFWPLVVVLISLLLGGCGSNHDPLGHVEGTVRYKGQPIAAGEVLFEVADHRPAQGKIIDGKIVDVTTNTVGDGVPLGHARIAVFAADTMTTNTATTGASVPQPSTPQEAWAASGKGMTAPKSTIPAKYNDLGASGLAGDIIAGQNEVNLELDE